MVHGKNTQVWLDALDISTYLTTLDLSADLDTADSTTFMSNWKTVIAGQAGGKVDAAGYYDPTFVQKFSPAMLTTPGSILTYGPGGLATAGVPCRLVEVASTSYSESSPVGGIVGFKWSVIPDTAIGFGQVLNPLSDLGASPATGANVDGTAATTTGWQAHLHVSAVSGSGSWVVKIVDASASNFSDVADVTGGAFTTTAAPTQQRLVSASGATLRRYVRCVATRTGGVVGDRITFALAIARNI